MPKTWNHFGFSLTIYTALIIIFAKEFNLIALAGLFTSELIDLDHLFSKPFYKLRRNPFKTHFLHKNWKFVLFFALILIIFFKLAFLGFLGLGLILHLFLDFVYTNYYLKL